MKEPNYIPKGTPHKPYTETADTILVKGTVAFPEKFAFNLSQVYGVIDNDPSFGKSLKTILQMAMFLTESNDILSCSDTTIRIQKFITASMM